MIQHTTTFDVVAEVHMIRSAFVGTVLIVEGDHDCRIYERFVDGNRCQVIPAHGKSNATKAIAILEHDKIPGVLTIVDADFWHILGRSAVSKNVVATDAHDIEILMIESAALDTVLREYANETKVSQFVEKQKASHLREVLLTSALPLGLLRLLSEEQSLGLRFKGLDHSAFVSAITLAVDEVKLAKEVAKLTADGTRVSQTTVAKFLKQAKKRKCEARQVCCGHDITALLAIAFRQAIARQNKSVADKSNMEKCLRMSYDLREFKKSNMYSHAKAWESANGSYKVFAVA